MDTIHLTDQDLSANKDGSLSRRQMDDLRRQRLVWIGGSAGIALIVLGLSAVLVLKVLNPEFADQGQLVIVVALTGFWTWILRHQPLKWRQANQDLRNGRVAQTTGTAETSLGMGIGIFRTIQYHVHVGQQTFTVSQENYRKFKPGDTYRVYHSPRAKHFLGAVAVIQEVESVSNAPSPQALIDPLTDRESEILALIAAGLSNKEIAAQLSLSTNTVKMYASQLYQKLDVSRRTEAVARAREIGLLDE